MFDPIPQKPRYRHVADALIERIADGSLPSGKKLPPDRVLVDQLGVSRATLREALIALEVMGYLETRFGSGAYVAERPKDEQPAQPTQPKIRTVESSENFGPFETLEARRLIEGELAALAAEQITAPQLDHLWDMAQRLDASDEWDADADMAFHATIAEAAGNAYLAHLAEQFWTARTNDPLWQAIEAEVEDSNRRPALVDEHEDIIAALTEGEPEAARAAMHAHLDSFTSRLLAQWDSETPGAEATPKARLSSSIQKN